VYARVGIHYVEYYLFWIFVLLQTICANWHVAPLIIGIVLLVIMLCLFLATARKTRSEDFPNLNMINSLKKLVIMLRIILIGMFLCFLYFLESMNLTWVKIFTVISFIILSADVVINLVILYFRLKGLCRPGSRYPYARMNQDYVELNGPQSGKLNSWLMSGRDSQYAEPVGTRNRNSQRMRDNRPSYRSNVISEIPSITHGTQYGRSKKSGFGNNAENMRYSNWQNEEWDKHNDRVSPKKGEMIQSRVISR
jgi:hypothetical protein